ncbi:CCA-adding enzyme [Bacteriophage DSS3_MAL1]|nr:CCA-adding enzyme [Bacteriophage DSS3_MAL1]
MKISPHWLRTDALQFVLGELSDGGRHAYCVGGCVRDAVLGFPVNDIDIATDRTPGEVEQVFSSWDHVRILPTGVDHGTWTVMIEDEAFEVTTFRKDVETDGRRATVAFAKSIEEDAQRRDFTMNALYMDWQGNVLDPTGQGMQDLMTREVRFIGIAEDRCREDYLRILRLFRFHAKYGKGPINADAYWASATCAHGLEKVSGERIWAELKKLLSMHDPLDALLEMQRSGVLPLILPEHADPMNVADVMAVERAASMAPGWERRFVALMGYDRAEVPFPHSKEERRVLSTLTKNWRRGMIAAHAAFITKDRARAYDCAVLARASSRFGWDDTVHMSVDRGLEAQLPVGTAHFMENGVDPGPALGECMRKAFSSFLASDLLATKEQLLNRVLERHPA